MACTMQCAMFRQWFLGIVVLMLLPPPCFASLCIVESGTANDDYMVEVAWYFAPKVLSTVQPLWYKCTLYTSMTQPIVYLEPYLKLGITGGFYEYFVVHLAIQHDLEETATRNKPLETSIKL